MNHLKNLTSEQLREDWYCGTHEEREAIRVERVRRNDEREERACRAEDERKDE